MDHAFWHRRWQRAEIGFHQSQTNRYLMEHWPELALPLGSQVFVPMCGKSLDMLWLKDRDHEVLGVEINDIAVRGFFTENNLSFRTVRMGAFEAYGCDGLTIFLGDFFDLQRSHLQRTAAVYDRAALVALPPDLRASYATKLKELLDSGVKSLLITIDYRGDPSIGPPFSVEPSEVQRLFADEFVIEQNAVFPDVESRGGLKENGVVRYTERVFTLHRR